MNNIKIAVVGFGEINIPREMIENRFRAAADSLKDRETTVIEVGPVTDDPEGQDVAKAIAHLKSSDFDAIVLVVAGWIPSHAVIDLIEPFRNTPMVLWGLSGWQEGDRFVTTADQAGTTALRHPMKKLGHRFKYIVNRMGELPGRSIESVKSYIRAAAAANELRGARLGQMGFRDMRLFGTLYDGVSLRRTLGIDVEFFEMLEIDQKLSAIPESKVDQWVHKISEEWDFVKTPQPDTIPQAVRLFLALQDKIEERNYRAVSFIDVDGVKKLWKFAPAGSFMMLHEALDICTIPENDTLGAVTQMMCHALTGQVSAYMEFYEFSLVSALIGVPDYVPPQVVDGRVTIMPNAFGQFGEGMLSISKVKTGSVTLARLAYEGDRYFLHLAYGEAVAPPKWEEAGWSPPAPLLSSLEFIIEGSIEHFIANVLGQHYIVTYGDNRPYLRDLCSILGIDVIES
jgi:L-fucose isomerase-like protein